MRETGPSDPSQVSVKNMQSIFLSKMSSLTRKVLLESDLMFSSAMFNVLCAVREDGAEAVCVCIAMRLSELLPGLSLMW